MATTSSVVQRIGSFIPPGGAAGGGGGKVLPGDPTAQVGPAAINGVAATFMRSDAAPALANTAVTAGSYTNTNLTIDAQGRITAAANGAAGGGGGGTVTSIAAGNGLSGGTITNSGTIGIAAPVSVANGGTGATTLTPYGLLAGNGINAVTAVGPGTANTVLIGAGGSANPSFQSLTQWFNSVVSILQGALVMRGPSQWQGINPGTAGQVLTSNGSGANLSWTTQGFGVAAGWLAGANPNNALIYTNSTGRALTIMAITGTPEVLETAAASIDVYVAPSGTAISAGGATQVNNAATFNAQGAAGTTQVLYTAGTGTQLPNGSRIGLRATGTWAASVGVISVHLA